MASMARRLAALESRLATMERDGSVDEAFYRALEDRFRGSEDDIRDRQRSYSVGVARIRDEWPDERRGDFIAVDLGSGRGELLDALAAVGVSAIGVDANEAQAVDARARGRDVRIADIFDFLAEQPDGSIGAVTAMHVIEHLPFRRVLDLIAEIKRVLAPDGVVMMETPNPYVLTVGAATFHLDPTHLKPIPHELIDLALREAGFEEITFGFVSPDPRGADKRAAGLDPDVTRLLFGPRDWAVRARKRL